MEMNDVRFVYLVGDLKQKFQESLACSTQALRAEALPKNPKCLSESCPTQEKVIGLTKSLQLLSAYFKDQDYVGLKALPSELTRADDLSAKPFYVQYSNFAYLKVTNAEVQKHPVLCDSLGKAALTL